MNKFAPGARPPALLLGALLTLTLGRPAAFGSSITTLYSFTEGNDGSVPVAGLTLGSDGSFYGMASEGGAELSGSFFQVTTNGALTPLYAFTDDPGGGIPESNLTLAANGSFYGTTYEGGTIGYGTVFQVTTNGQITILYSFSGGNDGAFPFSAPVLGSDGNLYGTTAHGGPYTASDPNRLGYGTVYQLTPNGTLNNLYAFEGSTGDGGYPLAGVTFGGDGALYGTASAYGANNDGTVFRVTTAGKFTALHSFQGNDGNGPLSNLTPTGGGGFYGTTSAGGAYSASDTNNAELGYGTVFQISTNGSFSSLYSFSGSNDGSVPNAVVLGADGALYGTTQSGGSGGSGVLFNLTQGGTLTTLAAFGGTNGANPQGALAQGPDGRWYGTTSAGGADGDGTIFVLGSGAVVTPPAPVFLSAAAAGPVFAFSWSSVPGQKYQVEYKTDLTQTVWNNLNQVTAAGSTASATDSLAYGARFYRVALVP